jgi:putative membrane protein
MLKRVLGPLALIAMLGLTLAQLSLADEQRGKGKEDKEPLTDARFVMLASSAGLAEVNMGRLAAQQGSSDEVRRFGQHMVDDHTAANKELNRIADAKSFAVAQSMNRTHQELTDKLAKMEGAAFDREFMSQQVKDHKKAVSLFEKESKHGQDRDLKAFATKTLPTLKKHLRMAEKIAGVDRKAGDRHETGTKRDNRSDRR